MDLRPHVPSRPPCPVETSEATRARRAARLARRRKAAQSASGEGIDQASTTAISTTEEKTIDQQYAVIFDQGTHKTKIKPRESSKEKLKKAEAQLQERTREHKNFLMTSETLRGELKTVKEQLGQITKQNKMLTEERDQAMREVEELVMNRDDLELEHISTTSFQGTMADLKQKIKKLEKGLETANNEIVSGETTIMILEEEKEELTVQLEKTKKMTSHNLPNDMNDAAKEQILVDGDALIVAEERIKMLTEERDKAMREVVELEMKKDELKKIPTTSSQASSDDFKYHIKRLEKKLEAANSEILSGESTILVLEGEREELADELEEMKKEKKNISANFQMVTREDCDSFEQLQELYSEVRSITGVSENVSPEDSAAALREVWHKHESRYQKLRDRVDGITERKRAAYANTQLLRESIEKLLQVEPGTLEITDLVEKIEDIDQYFALKIDNINAKLVEKQQSSKEKFLNIRDICRATATDMDIKFKKKTKISEFLALFSSEWTKLQGLVTSLDKKLLESDCRIEELESALDQMKEELEQTTTSKEIKKKKKRLLKTIINTMVPKQSADGKLLKIKDQADQIRRLKAIQESKYRQDHEVIALHREGNAVRQTLDDLQKRQKEQEDIFIDLNHRLDQEKETVKELREIIQIMEERNRSNQGEISQQNMTQQMHNEQ